MSNAREPNRRGAEQSTAKTQRRDAEVASSRSRSRKGVDESGAREPLDRRRPSDRLNPSKFSAPRPPRRALNALFQEGSDQEADQWVKGRGGWGRDLAGDQTTEARRRAGSLDYTPDASSWRPLDARASFERDHGNPADVIGSGRLPGPVEAIPDRRFGLWKELLMRNGATAAQAEAFIWTAFEGAARAAEILGKSRNTVDVLASKARRRLNLPPQHGMVSLLALEALETYETERD